MNKLISMLILIALFPLSNSTTHAQAPEFVWVVQAGTTVEAVGRSITTDGSGNSIVTGEFRGTSTFGDTTLSSAGSNDILIAKYDGDGNFLWVKQAGGTGFDRGRDIAMDGLGNILVTGDFRGMATFGDTTLTSDGIWSDIFIAKLGAGVTGIEEEFALPQSFNLSQSYPNPFNPSTTIEFYIPQTGFVILNVYNILGEVVTTLINEELNVGTYTTQWNASDVASGVYLYRLQSGDPSTGSGQSFVETKKMVLTR